MGARLTPTVGRNAGHSLSASGRGQSGLWRRLFVLATLVVVPLDRTRRGVLRTAVAGTAATLCVSCGIAPYRGVPEAADPPVIEKPTTTMLVVVPTPVVTTTTRPVPTTALRPPPVLGVTTTNEPTPALPVGWHVYIVAPAIAQIAIPDNWSIANTSAASAALTHEAVMALLPSQATLVASTGLFDQVRFLATQPRNDATLSSSVMMLQVAKAPGVTAVSLLTQLRDAVGSAAVATVAKPETSKLGTGAYVTYRWQTAGPNAIDVTSEQYAFARADTMLVVIVTTTTSRVDADGLVFGRMISSLAPTT